MPIIRGRHMFDEQFTQIPNSWLRDSRLSLKAIGLLAQVMSHQTGWSMSIRSLAKANGTGLGTIKSAAEELEKAGYLVRDEVQSRAEDGTFSDFNWVTCDPNSVDNPFQNRTPVLKHRDGVLEHKEEQDIKNIKNQSNSFSEDWKMSDELRSSLVAKYPNADLDLELEKMIDYYLANGKKKEVKDMAARFRTWMRNADKFANGALSMAVASEGLPQIGPRL